MAGNPNWIDRWSEDDLETLVYKREVERKTWFDIGAEMKRPWQSCYRRFSLLDRPDIAPSIVPRSTPRVPLHRQLGIETFVHRQAILCEPNGVRGNRGEQSSAHWYRVDITLPKVLA